MRTVQERGIEVIERRQPKKKDLLERSRRERPKQGRMSRFPLVKRRVPEEYRLLILISLVTFLPGILLAIANHPGAFVFLSMGILGIFVWSINRLIRVKYQKN